MRSPIRLRSAPPPPPELETVVYRAGGTAPEIRGDRRLCFYAAVFDVRSRSLTEGGRTFTEIIRPGAFTASLASGADVYACLEHDPAQTFARRSSGLMLEEDGRGLFASCYLRPDPFNDQILEKVRSRFLAGCSFGFRTVRERSIPAPEGLLIEQLAVHLVDVSLTRTPAYPGTVVSVRSEPAAEANRTRRLRFLRLRG